MVTIEKVSTREGFAALETQWNELLASSASNTIALTHQWLLTWWDVFNEGRELCLLLAHDSDRLIGIAPLLKRTVRHYGLLPFRRLEFVASGENEADEICSDYLDFIVQPERAKEIFEAFLDFLIKEESGWDELLLTDVAGFSPNLPILKEVTEARGLSWQVTKEQICIFVPLPDNHDAVLANVSSQKRKRIRKDRRVAKEQGMVAQHVTSIEGFDEAFATLVRLHQERWTSRGFPGSFASEKFTRFHRELAQKLLEKQWVQVWILWNGDEALYAIYDFVYAGKIFHYQSGMNPNSGPILSTGLLLRDLSFEQAIEAGFTECDFLKGDENSYKFGWGGETRPIVQVRVARSGARESLYESATGIVDKLRPVKRQVMNRLKKQEKAIAQ